MTNLILIILTGMIATNTKPCVISVCVGGGGQDEPNAGLWAMYSFIRSYSLSVFLQRNASICCAHESGVKTGTNHLGVSPWCQLIIICDLGNRVNYVFLRGLHTEFSLRTNYPQSKQSDVQRFLEAPRSGLKVRQQPVDCSIGWSCHRLSCRSVCLACHILGMQALLDDGRCAIMNQAFVFISPLRTKFNESLRTIYCALYTCLISTSNGHHCLCEETLIHF